MAIMFGVAGVLKVMTRRKRNLRQFLAEQAGWHLDRRRAAMRYLPWLLAGFGLLGASRAVEALGDGFPLAADGASPERLMFHSAALVILLGGFACFLHAGRLIYRSVRGQTPRAPAESAPAESVQAPDAFDPDAALARYLERKAEQGDSPPPVARVPATGFGRRGL